MAKKTKIKASAIAKAMSLAEIKNTIISFGTGEDIIDVSVKRHLSVSERAMMINDILNIVFPTEGDDAKYYAAFKKFAIDYNIVVYFTDISLPLDTDRASKFIDESGIVNKIADSIGYEYVADIIADATEAIEYRKQELLKK